MGIIEIQGNALCIPDAIYNRVVDGVSLCEERSPDGHEGADGHALEDTSVVDHQVGGPSHEPQGDCH